MRHSRRGLTLVEVLAALVLLVIVSSVAWSFLRDIRYQMDVGTQTEIDRAELGVAADAVLRGDALDAVRRVAVYEAVTVAWPDAITTSLLSTQLDHSIFPTRPEVTHRLLHIRRLAGSSSTPAGCWIACTADEEPTVVYRWISLPPDEPTAQPESADREQ